MAHLQKNGFPNMTACGHVGSASRTWNLIEVTCEACKKTEQYADSLAYGDIGSPGREISYRKVKSSAQP